MHDPTRCGAGRGLLEVEVGGFVLSEYWATVWLWTYPGNSGAARLYYSESVHGFC